MGVGGTQGWGALAGEKQSQNGTLYNGKYYGSIIDIINVSEKKAKHTKMGTSGPNAVRSCPPTQTFQARRQEAVLTCRAQVLDRDGPCLWATHHGQVSLLSVCFL